MISHLHPCAGIFQRLVSSKRKPTPRRGEPRSWEAVMRSARKNSMLCLVSYAPSRRQTRSASTCSSTRLPHQPAAAAAHTRSTSMLQHSLAAPASRHCAHFQRMQHPLAAALPRRTAGRHRRARSTHPNAVPLATALARSTRMQQQHSLAAPVR